MFAIVKNQKYNKSKVWWCTCTSTQEAFDVKFYTLFYKNHYSYWICSDIKAKLERKVEMK